MLHYLKFEISHQNKKTCFGDVFDAYHLLKSLPSSLVPFCFSIDDCRTARWGLKSLGLLFKRNCGKKGRYIKICHKFSICHVSRRQAMVDFTFGCGNMFGSITGGVLIDVCIMTYFWWSCKTLERFPLSLFLSLVFLSFRRGRTPCPSTSWVALWSCRFPLW